MSNINIWEQTTGVVPGELAYLSVACTTRCNLNCVYCSKKGLPVRDLDPHLLERSLEEAIDLGLQKVEFTGGEPLLYPHLMDFIQQLVARDITVLLVSNGTLLDEDTAKKLADWGVGVAISLSTLQEDRFDQLSQTKGLMYSVFHALECLNKAGFGADKMPMLSIQGIASRDSFNELEGLREFARKQNALFVVNRAIPVGGLDAKNVPAGIELKAFLDTEFPGDRVACVPFSSDSPCNRLKVGCYIGSEGYVKPCPAIDLVAGDLKEQRLESIWHESPVLNECRSIVSGLEGSCGNCPENHRCYGCRAVAFAVWGNLFAPDPGCFRFVPDDTYNRFYQKG